MNLKRKTRVLIVDDSAVVRRAISEALASDPEIEVVGTACDPYVARDKILETNPDVLTLDIEMPRMDGLTFLRVLQNHRPIPVIVVSSLTQAGSRAALDALEAGAVDVLGKPSSSWAIGELGAQLAGRIKMAAVATLRRPATAPAPKSQGSVHSGGCQFHPRQIILIGASTGGTEALKSVLSQLPAELPGICIVQHIPPVFSRAFAERLDEICALEVREAAAGDAVQPGVALIAPGDYHMMLIWNNGRYQVLLNQRPPVHFTRPSVDVLFSSVAACAGVQPVAALLTGMGSDGAIGMQQLKAAGATTLAQNEETCVVYGMPRAAVELGVVDQVMPLDKIPGALVAAAESRARANSDGRRPLQQAATAPDSQRKESRFSKP
jgi:two-component system chemotaxis response regulator CheB